MMKIYLSGNITKLRVDNTIKKQKAVMTPLVNQT
jgi:hypothetical protein